MTQSMNRARYKFIIALVVCFFVIGIVPVFSQQIVATFGFGRQWSDYEVPDFVYDENYMSPGLMVCDGWVAGANVLFAGSSGLTVSLGADTVFSIGDGMSFDPVFGIGYVYYNTLYLGGILNAIPKPFIGYERNDDDTYCDVFIAPTAVGGFDFGTFLLEARLAYLRGVMSGVNGFKFSIGAGVNLGSGGAYR